jgi:hypothetical protein
MAELFYIREGLMVKGNTYLTGSLIATAGITGSFTGSLTGTATSASLAAGIYTPGGTANQLLYQSAGGASSATTTTANLTYDSANTSLNATNVGIAATGTFSSTLDRSNNISMHDGAIGRIAIRNENVDRITIYRNGLIAVSGSTQITGSLNVATGITGSLQGTATTASYISPTFISSSAAASGFGGSSVTINNNTNDYVVTATGTANTLNGESALTFNGTLLSVANGSTSATPSQLLLKTTGAGGAGVQFENSAFPTNKWQVFVTSDSTGFKIGRDNVADYFTIAGSTGYVGIGTNTPNAKLDVNGNAIITGSLTVGTGSVGASENTLTLGARDAANEGGQIGFNAPGGTYTSASFIDNWSNFIRILRGTNIGSDALIAQWNLHTKQMQLPAYTGASSFAGTATANLAVDSSGNIITVSTSGGTVFPYTGNAVITGSLTATTSVIAQANGAMYFRGGDDAELWDINVTNTVGLYGQQDQTVGSLKLGSGGGTISGKSSNIGIGTTNPTSASLTVNGNVWASSFTGSLQGTATTASYVLNAISASYAPSTAAFPYTGNAQITGSLTIANAGVPLTVNSTNSNTFKISLQDAGTIRGYFGSGNGIPLQIGDSAGNPTHTFRSTGTVSSVGGIYIGDASTTPSGQIHTKGTGATSATTNILVQNSSATNLFKITDDGRVTVTGSLGISGGVTGSLSGTASYATQALSASWAPSAGGAAFPYSGSAQITGSLVISSSNATQLTLLGSGSTVPIFTVQGSQGELFSITDSLSGSLFSVNDTSGLPILEVFSDSTTFIGDYQAPALYTTKKIAASSGVNTIYSLNTGSYDGVFVDYIIRSGSNSRAGNFKALWGNGGTVNFTDSATADIGSTSGFTIGASVSGPNMIVTGSASTSGWTIKAIIRSI